jgi:type IV pilus assembly protein PilA
MTIPSRRCERPEPDRGFTLVELLVVMVVVGILAAVAVPMLHNVRSRAYIASVKSDVAAITKAVNALYVDGSRTLTVEGSDGTWNVLDGGDVVATGDLSQFNTVSANSYVLPSGDYCLSVENEKVQAQFWTADNVGLRAGDCAPFEP